MTINMDKLQETFFQESEEHLSYVESALLQFDVDAPDLEIINSIFRAVHSVKGGAGIFGLEALIELAHLMENLLDQARNEELTITTDTQTLLLETNDVLRHLLSQYSEHQEVDAESIANPKQALQDCLESASLIEVSADGLSENEVAKSTEIEGKHVSEASDGAAEDKFSQLLEDPALEFGFESKNQSSDIADKSETEDEKSGVFGFFDDEPTSEQETVSKETAIEKSGSQRADAFGFFDSPAEPATENQTEEFGFYNEPLVNRPVSDENSAFGFFDEPMNNTPQTSAASKNSSVQRNNVHSIKGAYSKKLSAQKARARKTLAKNDKKAGLMSSSIRVDTQKIDSLVNLVGELVITQSILQVIGSEVDSKIKQRLNMAITELKRNTREIQDSVMSMRMVPISNTFDRFPRVARDLSTQLGKKIDLSIEGGATEIDKGMIEKLTDPLTHLVRNSIDHGIEMPEQRRACGKPERGLITLRAEQSGGSILVNVIDDGAGLNRDKILQKASENGIHCHPDMSDAQVWELIFEAGFSTAENVTDVSGRGVGMDVVRRNIETIGGRIEIDSSPGKGCVFQIQLPLTLAILDGMCVTVGEQVFVIPLANIIESLQPLSSQLKIISNDKLLWIREQYWPLVSLADFMHTGEPTVSPENGVVVLVQTNKKRFGLVVNDLVGQQQVVIKSLEKHYKRVAGVAGATIMGDGSVALIADVESIAEASKLNFPEYHEEIAV